MSKASCLKYVGGSHKWGKWFIPRKFASLKNYKLTDPNIKKTDKTFEDIPDIDADPEKYELFAWDLEVMPNLKQGAWLANENITKQTLLDNTNHNCLVFLFGFECW